MKAQQMRLTKDANVRKGIPNVLMNYLFKMFSNNLPPIARINFIIVVARIHFKTNKIKLSMIPMNHIPYYITYY